MKQQMDEYIFPHAKNLIFKKILFQFGVLNDSIQFQYTGLSKCGREHLYCHRWIGQRNLDTLVQQYEWYWSAKYNGLDVKELIPIKVNLKTILKIEPPKIINQEISKFLCILFDYLHLLFSKIYSIIILLQIQWKLLIQPLLNVIDH